MNFPFFINYKRFADRTYTQAPGFALRATLLLKLGSIFGTVQHILIYSKQFSTILRENYLIFCLRLLYTLASFVIPGPHYGAGNFLMRRLLLLSRLRHFSEGLFHLSSSRSLVHVSTITKRQSQPFSPSFLMLAPNSSLISGNHVIFI
jgi:hypothetical protein